MLYGEGAPFFLLLFFFVCSPVDGEKQSLTTLQLQTRFWNKNHLKLVPWYVGRGLGALQGLIMFVFFPLGLFLSSRVTGACPVITDLIMRVIVRTTTINLPTLPRIFIHVARQLNSIAFAIQRQLAYPSVPVVATARAASTGRHRYYSSSASCRCMRMRLRHVLR